MTSKERDEAVDSDNNVTKTQEKRNQLDRVHNVQLRGIAKVNDEE